MVVVLPAPFGRAAEALAARHGQVDAGDRDDVAKALGGARQLMARMTFSLWVFLVWPVRHLERLIRVHRQAVHASAARESSC